jgi:hypothetical protein
MENILNLFISHSWDDNQKYYELKELITSLLGDRWRDLSISKDNAFAIATGGELEKEQKRQLLNARIKDINDRLKIIKEEHFHIGGLLANLRYEVEEIRDYQQLDLLFARARERILENDFVSTIKRLEKLENRYSKIDVNELLQVKNDKITEIAPYLYDLERDESWLRRELLDCEESLETMNVFFGSRGKQRDNVIKKHPNLAIAIRNQLAIADAVLVIVYPYSSYREWLEFEYQEAFVLKKTIFGLLDGDRCTKIPPDLARFGIKPIKWSSDEISFMLKSISELSRNIFHTKGNT